MLKKILRSVSVLLTLALLFSIVTCAPFSIGAAETDDTSAAVATASENPFGELSGGKYTLESMTYQLTADFAAEGYLNVPSDVEATIDLNGHTIDRGRSGSSSYVNFIVNNGTLTITDSSGDNSGKITGGYAQKGGAVVNNGTLTINGGTFEGNRAFEEAGAVLNNSGATLTVNGGVFTNNSTVKYGGGAFVNFGTMTFAGGTIKDNRAAMDAGAIFNSGGASLTITGGKISGNSSGGLDSQNEFFGKAGGVYNDAAATLYMSGEPVIKDNANGNLWLGGSSVINITEAPGSNAKVDVRADNMPRAVTSGFSGTATGVFTFGGGRTGAKKDSNGEIVAKVSAEWTVNSWATLKTAVNNAGDGDTIALSADITNTSKEKSIHVSDKIVYIDLRGHTVDVNRKDESTGDDYHFMYVEDDGVLAVKDSYGGGIIKNGNATSGGAFDTDTSAAELYLYNITIQNNKASEDGGAIRNRANLYVENCVFVGNSSSDDGGAIMVYDDSDSCYIKNSVFIGNSSSSQSGAIDHNRSITSTLENTFIVNNTAADIGGGIYVRYGTVEMIGGAVIGNSGTEGGGVYVEEGKTFTADGTLFSGNKTTSGSGSGGAVYSHGTASLANCVVSGNTANGNGGALYNGNNASNATLTNTVLQNNSANRGGAVYINTAAVNMTGCTVTGNTASVTGGAVYTNSGSNPALNAVSTVFKGNSANSQGGGAIAAYSNIQLEKCTVTGNTANTNGGGVWTDHTLTIKGTTVIDNNGSNNVYLQDNAQMTISGTLPVNSRIGIEALNYDRVHVTNINSGEAEMFFIDNPGGDEDDFELNKVHDSSNKTLTIKRVNKVSVSSWSALQQGIRDAQYETVFKLSQTLNANGASAMQIPSGKTVTIDLNGFNLNRGLSKQGSAGHVIQMKGSSTLAIRDTSENHAGKVTGGWAEHGGGINLESSSTCTLESGNISGNHAKYGGGVWNVGTFTTTGGSISDNIASEEGGGIYGQGTTKLSGCVISGNSAKYGGGIYFDKKPNEQSLTNVSVKDNTASTRGAGIFLQTGTVTLTNGDITGNTATDGGAVYVTDSTTLNATGTKFKSNKSTAYSGGAIVNHETINLTDCTIDSNRAYNNGAGIWTDDEANLTNCTITNNKLTEGKGGGIYLKDGVLNIDGGVIKKNLAAAGGSGIYYEKDADGFNLKGDLVAQENAGNDILLPNGKKINIVGTMTENANVTVNVENYTATFTTGFKATFGENVDPALYFSTDPGSSVILDENGEAMVIESDWTLLRKQIANAASGTTITLDRDWTAIESDISLTVPADKSITIDLNGYTIDGQNAMTKTIFDVRGTLTIKDTSANKEGKITGGTHSAIENYGTLYFESGNITGNTANSNGGGIENKGIFVMNGGVISDNTTKYGGGIYNTVDGTFTMNGGKITGNTANNYGGGIFNMGTVTINGGEITGNTSKAYGGGINNRGTLNLFGGTISENNAVREGGGINVQDYPESIQNVNGSPVVENNNAPIGDNILLTNDKVITLTGTLNPAAKLDVVTKNTANPLTSNYSTYIGSASITYNGTTSLTQVIDGELYFKGVSADKTADSWDNLQTAINNSTSGQVIKLTANLDGTGKSRLNVNNKTVTIDLNGHTIDRKRTSGTGSGQVFGVTGSSDLTISDAAGTGVITGGYSHDGGGVFIDTNATLTMTGGSIQGNTADNDGGDGGGVYNKGTLIMEGGAIAFNKADDTGGGIYSTSSGTIRLNNALITGNYSDDDDGGGMNLHLKDSNSYIKNSVITNNECGENNGGGIRLDAKGKTLTIENTYITGNKADEAGGGFYITEGTIDISDSFVNDNNTESGGGAYLEGDTKLIADNTEFCGNKSSKNGGGINCHGKATLTNCKINKNTSSKRGGGLYMDTGDDVTITGANTEIKENTSSDKGGGVFQENGKLTVEDFTVSDNVSMTADGGAFYLNEGGKETFIARNVKIINNKAGTDKSHRGEFSGGAIFLNHGTAKLYNCEIKGNWARFDGGAIAVTDDTKLYVNDTTFTENTAVQRGSAIFMKDDGETHLHNVTITGNLRTDYAIYADEDLYISGRIIIQDNDDHDDVYLDNGEPIVLEDALTSDSRIGVALADKTGDFTKKFKEKQNGDEPSKYFFANKEGYSVQKNKKGEGKIVSTDWIELQRAIDAAATSGETVLATKNYTADDTDKTLVIPASKTVTIDLMGFTLDGNRDLNNIIEVKGTLNIQDSSPSHDGKITGSFDGSGVYIAEGGTLNLQNGVITGNTSDKDGGGICNKGTLNVTGGEITSNTAVNGGGVYNAGTMKLYGGKIENNSSVSGGGIYCAAGSTLRTKGSPSVIGNSASEGKNILLNKGVVITLDGALSDSANLDLATKNYTAALTSGFGTSGSSISVFSYNENDDIQLIETGGELYFPNSLFGADIVWVNNWTQLQDAVNADANQGKTIGLATDLTPDGQKRIVVDNKNVTIELAGHTMDRGYTSKHDQGNVFKVTGSNARLTIKDTVESGAIRGGYADGDGGGFYVVDGATLVINGGSVIGNKCSSDGAGIYVDDATLVMNGGAVSGNKSSDNGGGIYTSGSAKITLNNAVIFGNISKNGGGGMNLHLKESATFTNCDISSNESEKSDGGGISMDASGKTLNLVNTKVNNNIADDEGGGVYLDAGTINMSGGEIDGNTSVDGGGVYITGGDHFNMTGEAVVSNNSTTEKCGGGITCHGYLTINNASVKDNHSEKHGGGIFYQNSGKTITLTDATISGNDAENDGGGIYIKQGTVTLSGGLIDGNTSKDGGGVFVTDDTDFNATSTTFSNNEATEQDGGAIVNKGDTKLITVTIQDNTTKNSGGGIWNDEKLEIANSVIKGNKAEGGENGSGGGIALVDGNLYLTGENTITENSAGIHGAGVYVDNEADNIYIQDKPIVKENYGSNIFLDDEKLTINSKLEEGAMMGITFKAKETELGVFTKNFSKKNPNDAPSAFFVSDDLYEVYLNDDGEAALNWTPDEDNGFVSRDDNILDPAKATGKNWMGSVSGERYIWELNLPRTHDASMNRVDGETHSSEVYGLLGGGGIVAGVLGALLFMCALIPGVNVVAGCIMVLFGTLLITGGIAGLVGSQKFISKCEANAKTQLLYLDEQMEAGVREFDMRLNPSKTGQSDENDDGENLWLCHGKSPLAGTYFGCDHEGDRMTLNQFLDWAKDFLRKHPTEVIEFTTTVETTNVSGDTKTVDERLRRILKDLSREVNPSTGKSYLYMKDGVFNKQYDLPQLKECRGQILVTRLTDDSKYPRFSWGTNLARYAEAPGMDISLPEKKVRQAQEGLRKYPSPKILTDALTHRNFFSGYFFNTTDDENKLLDTRAPIEMEQEIYYGAKDGSFEGLFLEGGEFNQHGKYVGRMGMDAVTAKEARMVYSSNFYDEIQYRTITVRSGLPGDDSVKTYTVLKGTKITIPDCIYDYNPAVNGYFQNWKIDSGNNGDRTPDYAIQDDNPNKEWLEEHTYEEPLDGAIIPDANSTVYVKPNDVLCVMDDIEVTATWGSDINTPVEVIWKDGNNADGLRPEKLTISYMNNGSDEADSVVVPSDNWKATITGETLANTVAPDWDQLDDEAIGYRYEVSGTMGKGFTITMYHAPQTTVTVAGTISWDDMDDHYQKRPDSVTLHLIKNGEELESTDASAASGWAYSFGNYAQYEDYEEVVYSVLEDEIDSYAQTADGFNFTNTHYKPEDVSVGVQIDWKDSGNAKGTRPDTYTVVLSNGEEVVEEQTVKNNRKADLGMILFDTEKYEEEHIGEEINYNVTVQGIPDSYTSEITLDESTGIWLITNTLIDEDTYFKGHSMSMNGFIGMKFYMELTPEEAENATVSFSWLDKEKENVRLTEDSETGLYTATCPVAAAEMNCEITAVLTINGQEADREIYSVARYANDLLLDDNIRDTYLEKWTQQYGDRAKAEEKYAQLLTFAMAMLEYGSYAQLYFDVDTENLANGGYDVLIKQVTADSIDSDAGNMHKDLADYGLDYQYSSVSTQSGVTLRHYYEVTDEDLFNAVKDNIKFDGVKVTPLESDGLICIEKQDIGATDIDTQYALTIGSTTYRYSVLDYCSRVIKGSDNDKLVNICKTLYQYNQMADLFFEDTSGENGYIIGDANHDNRVSIKDVTEIQRNLALMDTPGFSVFAADIDGNGLNITDATNIQRWLAEYDDPYDIGKYHSESVQKTEKEYELPYIES